MVRALILTLTLALTLTLTPTLTLNPRPIKGPNPNPKHDPHQVAYGAPWCPWSRRMEPVCTALQP